MSIHFQHLAAAALSILASVLLMATSAIFAADLTIPAHTAYMLPDPHSARMIENEGVVRWRDSSQSLNWYGEFSKPGSLNVKVRMTLQKDASMRMRLAIEEQSREETVAGEGKPTLVDFGAFEIKQKGHHRIQLQCLEPSMRSLTSVGELVLSGAACESAHFNMKERRNAASVHLSYKPPVTQDIDKFYCEVTAVEDPTATFYMACGWHRGYFGMQVNSPTERRIIFSVWDSGNEAIDRDKVSDENRVKLMGKGEGVYSGDFGNEGTGGHSHLKYVWRTGETQRFLVTATPTDKTFTIYSGYWFHPDKKEWMLISSWKAPFEGGYMRGVHSFSENFDGSNGHLPRKALYGNQWVHTADGKWHEITAATFSHDPTGRKDRKDRFMGVEDGRFFLSHGGFMDGYSEFGERFERAPLGKAPADLNLPPIEMPSK